MTQTVEFTQAAQRNCRRYGIDRQEAEAVLNDPYEERRSEDPGDRATEFIHSVQQMGDGRWMEVTWEQLADRARVRRVIVIEREAWGG